MKSNKVTKKPLFVILIIVVVLIFCISILKGEKMGDSNDNEFKETMIIKTSYCDLHLPIEYKDKIEGKIENNKVEFIVKDDRSVLFTLYFNEKAEYLLGTLVKKTGNVILYAEFAQLDDKHEHYELYCEYQELINNIIENLAKEYNFVKGVIVETDDKDMTTFDIATKVVILKYPQKWEEKADIIVGDKRVDFFTQEEKLFAISFEDCEGSFVGCYKDTPVYVISYTIDETKYSKEEYDMMCEMKEDINVILDNLKRDENFQ